MDWRRTTTCMSLSISQDMVTVFRGTQELPIIRVADVNALRLSRVFKASAWTRTVYHSPAWCSYYEFRNCAYTLQVGVIYLEREDGEEPAIFPQTGGRFQGLTVGKRYRLCGDSGDCGDTAPAMQSLSDRWSSQAGGQPTLGAPSSLSSSSSLPPHSQLPIFGVVGETSYSRVGGVATAPPPSRSWSGFRSVASGRKNRKVLEVKKTVDLCTIEVANSRLQLGEVRSSTFIRVVETDVCLATITELVYSRFEAVLPDGNTIVLVDTRVVPFPDDEGTRGERFCTCICISDSQQSRSVSHT